MMTCVETGDAQILRPLLRLLQENDPSLQQVGREFKGISCDRID